METKHPEARAWLNVDLEAIRHNYRCLKQAAGDAVLRPVIKANAYGLGAEKIAAVLREEGAETFCVAEYREAESLLHTGAKLQMLGHFLDFELGKAVSNGVILGVSDIASAEKINAEAEKQGVIAECHFKMDTGMGRIGTLAAHAPDVIRSVKKLPNIDLTGIYSHFPMAYKEDSAQAYSEKQIARFKRVLNVLERNGITFKNIHFGNSDAFTSYEEIRQAPYNGLRPGLALYGVTSPAVKAFGLKNAVTLHSRLAGFKVLPGGSTVGYNCTCKLKKDTLVGIVSLGYADGLPLQLSNNAEFLFRGRLCPVLGRISMDYTAISLDGFLTDEIQTGEVVTCIGTDGGNEVTWEDVAERCGTHVYTLLTSVGPRVVRNYI